MTQKDLIGIRYHAANLAESMAVAYWVTKNDQNYHICKAIESFEKVADLMGYDITKREEPVETEAA